MLNWLKTETKLLGPDEISTEIMKILDNSSIKMLIMSLNYKYKIGQISEDSYLRTLPKKLTSKNCDKFLIIS